jgi:hypothetical protein
MTLVISYVNSQFVMQVSDRKLTNVETGDTMSLNTNKMVLFCQRLAFGFTGIARIADGKGGLIATDKWLAKLLHSLPKDSSSHTAVYAIRDRAAEAIAATKATNRKHLKLAFCGTGWIRRPNDNDFSPFYCEISNFHDMYGQALDEPRREFTVGHRTLKPTQAFAFKETGVGLSHQQHHKLKRSLVRCHIHSPRSVLRILANFVQEIASTKSVVGKDMLAAMIPRGAAGLNAVVLYNGEMDAGFSPYAICEHALAKAKLLENRMQFLFLHESSLSPVQYAPTMVWPGRYLSDGFKVETNWS